MECIGRLEPSDQEVLVECHLNGKTQQRIATSMGVTQQAVAKRMRRALLWLRRELSSKGLVFSLFAAILSLAKRSASAAAPGSVKATLASAPAAATVSTGAAGFVKITAMAVLLLTAVVVYECAPPRHPQEPGPAATAVLGALQNDPCLELQAADPATNAGVAAWTLPSPAPGGGPAQGGPPESEAGRPTGQVRANLTDGSGLLSLKWSGGRVPSPANAPPPVQQPRVPELSSHLLTSLPKPGDAKADDAVHVLREPIHDAQGATGPLPPSPTPQPSDVSMTGEGPLGVLPPIATPPQNGDRPDEPPGGPMTPLDAGGASPVPAGVPAPANAASCEKPSDPAPTAAGGYAPAVSPGPAAPTPPAGAVAPSKSGAHGKAPASPARRNPPAAKR